MNQIHLSILAPKNFNLEESLLHKNIILNTEGGEGRETGQCIKFLKVKIKNITFRSYQSVPHWNEVFPQLQCLPELSQSLTIKMSLFKNLFSRGENWKDCGSWSHCRPRHLFKEKKC